MTNKDASPPQPHQPQVADDIVTQGENAVAIQCAIGWLEALHKEGKGGGHLPIAIKAILASVLRAKPAPDFAELEALEAEMRGYNQHAYAIKGSIAEEWADRIEAFIRGRK